MTVKVGIHQPNYIPSKAFFDKMKMCDYFVLLDDVQYEKNGFTNRNRIVEGEWLTIPVHRNHDTLIKDIEIDNTINWKQKHRQKLTSVYGNEPTLEKYCGLYDFIFKLYEHPWKNLIGINLAWIKKICEILEIKTNTTFSTSFDNGHLKGSDKILDICERLGATHYVSGPSGRKYLNTLDFDNAGITIEWLPSQPPTTLSILDDIFRGKI